MPQVRQERWTPKIGQSCKVENTTDDEGSTEMSKAKRRRFSAEFKAKVALEALKGEQSLSELAVRYEIHPNMIAQWKRQAAEGLVEVFSGKGGRSDVAGEAQIKELHAKIGQLTIERDFLARASGR